MLSVVLLILKIIGITILVLLGILLFLLLIILFVPIRYRIKVEHGDAFILEGGVSWLLHLIHGRITQTGSNRRIWIRIMGILVYDSLHAPRVKKVKAKRKIKHSKEATSKENIITKDEIISKKTIASDDKIAIKETIASDDEITSKETTIASDDEITSKDIIKTIDIDPATEEESHPKESLLTRLYNKIKAKIINFFCGIIKKIKELIQRFINIKNKISLIQNFINDDNNRRGFRFTYSTLKKILKHILPRKLRSRLVFGTGDPCTTGQALGILGVLYSFYGDNLKVTPDFENKVFKGSHYARGRIRIWTLLIIVIKLLLDKRFKDLKMNYQLLKEAL
jgi:hypothetical protein